MRSLCSGCNICSDFMPEQEEPRILRHYWGWLEDVDTKPVLIVDDCPDKRDIARAKDIARDLVQGTDFVYTNTIRCDYLPGEISEAQRATALSRCAVWTHQLLENRLLVITTKSGLSQMRAGEDRAIGEMWKNARIGVLLCIPPLLTLKPHHIEAYQAKVNRVLKREMV